MAGPNGLLEPGNIDLTKRPVVKNADGSISTVRSMSTNIDGQEVLIPTVSDDGKILDDDAAVDLYMKTGKHLGKFSSPDAATSYAETLHQDQEKLYGGAAMPTQLPPELQGLQLDLPNINDPKVNSVSNQNGLDWWQRFLVKNLFDTQPNKRKAYLNQLGYEMGKDGESYRPIGSDAAFIDIEDSQEPPKDHAIPLAVFVDPDAWQEFAKDLGDVAFDVVVEGPLTSVGQVLGGQAGLAGGAAVTKHPAGAAAGQIAGGIAGSAAGKAVAESIKGGLANWILDDENQPPQDVQETVYQSIMTGLLSTAGRLGADGLKKWTKIGAEKTQKMLQEIAVRKSNGAWNMDLAKDFAQNPEKYTPENVKGATRKLLEFADSVFGSSAETPHTTRMMKGGIAAKTIDPLNKRADLEIEKLSHMPEANFTVEEIVATAKDRIKDLKGKKFPTQDEERAVKFLSDEVEKLKSKMKKAPESVEAQLDEYGRELAPDILPDQYGELTYKEGRDILKRWQNAAYEEGVVKNNGTMKRITHGLKELADAKAGSVGSDLPKINLHRSKIIQADKVMRDVIKKSGMQAANTGKPTLAKEAVKRSFEMTDEVLGTKLSKGAETLQWQHAVNAVYEAPAAFGSGSVLADAMRQGVREASTGGFGAGSVASAFVTPIPFIDPISKAKIVGGIAALGGAKGFIQGAKKGASFSSPDVLVDQFSKVKATLDVLNKEPKLVREILQGVGPLNFQGAANLAATQVGSVAPSAPQPPLQAAINPEPGAGPTAGAGVDQAANGGGQTALPPELADFQLVMPEADENP